MSEEMSVEKVRAIASQLSSLPVSDVNFAGAGSNSRVFRVRASDREFALKFFRKNADGVNSRLAAELAASRCFKTFNISNAVELVHHSDEYNCALFHWIDGSKIESITRLEIDAALSFIKNLVDIGRKSDLHEFPLGTEACVSGAEVVSQVQKRLVNLDKSISKYPELADFLETKFKPLFKNIIDASKAIYVTCDQKFDQNLDKLLILSPVDFGFHNAIKKDGEVIFFDFEYFGWDDPTHLIADVVLHPGMNIADELKDYFARSAFSFLKECDSFFEARYYALTPLYALRWACIILNPFVLDYKVVGSNSVEDLANLRKRQLTKAEAYVKKAADALAVLESYTRKLTGR